MAKSYVDQLVDEIVKDLKPKIQVFLEKIADEIRDDLADRARAEVYGVYTPSLYKRRYTLQDTSKYKVEVGDMSISVTPVAEFNRAFGGWNYGNELGGFINFGRGWHGYVMGNGWGIPDGGPLNVPLPRPYISNTVTENWNETKIKEKLRREFGEWADVIDIKMKVGDFN